MNLLFKYLSPRFVIDLHPSSITFTNLKDGSSISIPTFLYIENSNDQTTFITLGQEIPVSLREKPGIYRVKLLENEPLPPGTIEDRNSFLGSFFAYGIARLSGESIMPVFHPIIFIMGADQFREVFPDPLSSFRDAAIRAGAGEVFFNTTDI